MSGFFDAIAGIVGTVVDFVVNALSALVMLFTVIPKAIAYLTYSIAFLPPAIVVFATLAIATSVILLVIGRNS